MNLSFDRFLLPAVLAAALCACTSGESATPPGSAPPSAWLAMARGQVDVEGGIIAVSAPRDGRVASVRVEDGDLVKTGEVLATLDDVQAHSALAIARAELAQAQAQLGVLKARLGPAQQLADRTGEAAKAGASSGQSADEAATALAVLQQELLAGVAAVKLAHEHVTQAQAEVDARSLRAVADGRIVQRRVHVGDVVSTTSGAALFELLPDRPRIVRAELNEAYVDLIKPGMQAEVVRDSDTGKPVMAQVLRVGEVFGPSRLTDDPIERAGVHAVDCVLRLEGGDFRIGQRVLVRFPRGAK